MTSSISQGRHGWFFRNENRSFSILIALDPPAGGKGFIDLSGTDFTDGPSEIRSAVTASISRGSCSVESQEKISGKLCRKFES